MFCKECGVNLNDNAKFCPFCGKQTKSDSVAEALKKMGAGIADKVTNQVIPSIKNMINACLPKEKCYCEYCGTLFNENEYFCSSCGSGRLSENKE